MKKLIIVILIALVVPQITQGQGTTYVSNVGQASIGSSAVGSDSWLTAVFETGNSSGGYILDSIQIAMSGASGIPAGFTVMLYSGFIPSSRLATLNGSPNPSTAGVYDFTGPPGLVLAPGYYNIVLTTGTPIANGAYEWSYGGTYNTSGGWAGYFIGAFNSFRSTDGSSWFSAGQSFQYAINATAVPEPGVSALLALGGLCFLWLRRKANAVE